jgi:hypothetical protein
VKKILLFSLLAFSLSGLNSFAEVSAQDSQDINDSTEDNLRLHVYDDVDLLSTIKYQYAQPKITIKLVYPQLESDSDNPNVTKFNQLVLDKIQEKILFFKKEAKTLSLTSPVVNNNELNVDFDTSSINANNNQLISIRLIIQAYITGMAHPAHQHDVLNFNLDTGEQLELSDLFKKESDYLTILSSNAREILFKRLTDTDKEMIIEGTTPTIEHFKTWNIKSNGLMITFDEGSVAPYVNGIQTVLIPFAALKNIISPQSPIAKCAMVKKNCSRNKLLTGSFIDHLEV